MANYQLLKNEIQLKFLPLPTKTTIQHAFFYEHTKESIRIRHTTT